MALIIGFVMIVVERRLPYADKSVAGTNEQPIHHSVALGGGGVLIVLFAAAGMLPLVAPETPLMLPSSIRIWVIAAQCHARLPEHLGL